MTLKEKLFNIQCEVGKMTREKTNPFFKSKYFDINDVLEHLKPLFEKYKILVTQPLGDSQNHKEVFGGDTSITLRVDDVESDDSYEYTIRLPECKNAQEYGSAITYFRRYALQSFFSLQAEDDDGNKATFGDASPKRVPYEKVADKKVREEKNLSDKNNGVAPF